jgi:hypothetical protein
MYKVIGVDGQHYGPASAEQIRRWITENRVNAQSLAQSEGASDWKPLSQFPEFADAFSSQARTAGTPPAFGTAPPTVDAEALAAAILARDYHVDIGRCVSRGLDLLLRNFWLMVGGTLVLTIIANAAMGLLQGVCLGCIYLFILRLARGQRVEFGDIFLGFSVAFLQLFLTGLISSILTVFGYVLCILPGIYLTVAWIFALLLVADKKLDFWPAMELSRKVVTKHWWSVFGLLLVCFLVVLLGLAACGVGVFVAYPVVFGAIVYAYEDIFNPPAATQSPAPPTT